MNTKILFAIVISCLCLGCNQHSGKKQQTAQSSKETLAWEQAEDADTQSEDSVATEGAESEELGWEDIPADGDVKPLDFEKWLTIMRHIHNNHFARPTAKMMADAGLEVMYETDDMDEDSLKSVHFIYGRELKRATDSEGATYYTFNGPHAVMLEVFAYTSSGAELHFHHPSDMRDFMEQAVRYGVAIGPSETYIVCEKPLGNGIHKVKNAYMPEEKHQNTVKELFRLNPVYEPESDWQTCYIALDFLPYCLEVD